MQKVMILMTSIKRCMPCSTFHPYVWAVICKHQVMLVVTVMVVVVVLGFFTVVGFMLRVEVDLLHHVVSLTMITFIFPRRIHTMVPTLHVLGIVIGQ